MPAWLLPLASGWPFRHPRRVRRQQSLLYAWPARRSSPQRTRQKKPRRMLTSSQGLNGVRFLSAASVGVGAADIGRRQRRCRRHGDRRQRAAAIDRQQQAVLVEPVEGLVALVVHQVDQIDVASGQGRVRDVLSPGQVGLVARLSIVSLKPAGMLTSTPGVRTGKERLGSRMTLIGLVDLTRAVQIIEARLAGRTDEVKELQARLSAPYRTVPSGRTRCSANGRTRPERLFPPALPGSSRERPPRSR